MSKRRVKSGSTRMKSGMMGCLGIIVIAVVITALGTGSTPTGEAATSRPDVRNTATNAPGVTIIPTVVVNRTATPALPITPMAPIILYTVSDVNLRSCPNTSCAIVQKVASGAALAVDGIVAGEAVDVGNVYWYKVEQSETDEYGYSRFFSSVPPTQLQQNAQVIATNQAQIKPKAAVQQLRPDNCSTAVAMGMSAVEAAQAGLDRDGDNVACYGD